MISVEKWEGFGKRLREIREAAGLTQEDVGEAVGMHGTAIARLESGKTKPSWKTAVKIAEFLERPLNDFLPEEG